MYRVDIYLESDSRYLGVWERKAGYYISCTLSNGQDYSDLKVMGIKGTYNHCLLAALNAALHRMRQSSEIHIYSGNAYILDMLDNNLTSWAGKGFKNGKGEPVKDREQWEDLWKNVQGHIIVTERGLHEYSRWLKWMLARDGDKTVDNFVDKPEKPHKYKCGDDVDNFSRETGGNGPENGGKTA